MRPKVLQRTMRGHYVQREFDHHAWYVGGPSTKPTKDPRFVFNININIDTKYEY